MSSFTINPISTLSPSSLGLPQGSLESSMRSLDLNGDLSNEYGAEIDIEVSGTEHAQTQGPETPPNRVSPCSSLDGKEAGSYDGGNFEGPEKTLEVMFQSGAGAENGLRSLTREKLDHLCRLANCTILSSVTNNYIDAYVLSESSLFVYKNRFIMKTCGTTTLLRCLSSLLNFADELGMKLTWVGYSRKNLINPTAQLWPHSNFGDEIQYISSHKKLQDRLKGSGNILGPVTGDHWFVYVADLCPGMDEPSLSVPEEETSLVPALPKPMTTSSSFASLSALPDSTTASTLAPAGCPYSFMERTVNLMMFDIAPEVGSIFYQKSFSTAKEMTQHSGISTLCPGANIDDNAFTPCGYSMNAILHDAYYTIHITPEPECSYASFETNTCLRDYGALIRNVLSVFRPKRFVVTMFGDEYGVRSMPELPVDPKHILLPNLGVYSRSSVSSTNVANDLCCMMACYSLNTSGVTVRSLVRVPSTVDLSNPASVSVTSSSSLSSSPPSSKSISPITAVTGDLLLTAKSVVVAVDGMSVTAGSPRVPSTLAQLSSSSISPGAASRLRAASLH